MIVDMPLSMHSRFFTITNRELRKMVITRDRTIPTQRVERMRYNNVSQHAKTCISSLDLLISGSFPLRVSDAGFLFANNYIFHLRV